MMRTLKYMAALAAAALLAVACTRDRTEDEPLPAGPPCSDMPIRWEVSTADDTRVLIGEVPPATDPNPKPRATDPNDPNFYTTLSEVCKLADDDPYMENGFAVGLFGDYSYEEGTSTVYVQDLFRGARLVYVPGSGQPDSDQAPSAWRYNEAMKYWRPGAKYTFRAYYPQRLHTYTITTSNAKTLAMTYPSRKLQYDLLLGVEEVDTKADGWSGSQAVNVELHHALSALRFKFRLKFADADFLTSVYLLNDTEWKFFSQGTVSFGGDNDVESITWLQSYNPPDDEVLYKWVPPLKYWYGAIKKTDASGNDTYVIEDRDKDGVIEKEDLTEQSAEQMLALWGCANGEIQEQAGTFGKAEDNPVLMISQRNDEEASAGSSGIKTRASGEATPAPGGAHGITYAQEARSYYGVEYYYDWQAKSWLYTPADNRADEGLLYCRNSGWLLIPPQQSYGKLTLCFTSKKGGNTVYKVNLPMETGTWIDPETGKEVLKTDPNAQPAWVAGKRYTYTVTLSQSDLAVALSIEPWNERKHSTEIIF